jgi:chemotaxis protein CheC
VPRILFFEVCHMPQDRYDSLNSLQLDILKEIANIGAGNAATALADILADRVDMSVPDLQITDIGSISEALGGPEKDVVCILISVTCDFKGMLMFIMEKQITHKLLSLLLNKQIDSWEQIDEMDLSMLKEIGNIIGGTYIGSLASMTDLDIRISPPEIAIDMVGAVLSYPAAIFGTIGDKVLFVKEDFDSSDDKITCHLLIIPLPDSLEFVLKRLGGAYE